MWLAEAGGLRILFDPLLGETYHDGVFEVVPRRRVDIDALRPDLVVVTHRHPDHFDIDSLDQLAQRYPQAVVLTADVLVGETCQKLGFAHVSLLGDWQHLALDGVDLLTTPSYCSVDEWGILVATGDGVVWNQVDTELGQKVRPVLARAAEILQRPAIADGLSLAIARWQPLLQVDAVLGRATNFPTRTYAAELNRIAACRAQAIIPGAAGSQVVGHGRWLNAFAYPVSPARLARDLARRCPEAAIYPARPGARWRLHAGAVAPDTDSTLVEVLETDDQRSFRPLSLPPLTDPDPKGIGDAALLAAIAPWVQGSLARPVGERLAPLGGGVVALEVVFPSGHEETWTLEVSADAIRVTRGAVAEPDLINQIAASDLVDVIAGEAHWGRPLLSGRLRSVGALYTVGPEGLEAMRLPPFFLYLALPYAEATARWVSHAVQRSLSSRAP